MKSKYEGLWQSNNKNWYISAVLNATDLAKINTGNWRVAFGKNKYYIAGSNKPEYLFSFLDAKHDNPSELDFSKDRYREIVGELIGLLNLTQMAMEDPSFGDINDEVISSCQKMLNTLGVRKDMY